VSILAWIATVVAIAAIGCAGMRWLRVAQREHYLPGRVSLFAWRWWSLTPLNRPAALVALACLLASAWIPIAGVVTAAVVISGPVGLGLRGRTARLAWTRRLKTLAAVCAVTAAALVIVGVVVHQGALFAGIVAAGVPLLVDGGLAVTRPLESILARRYVESASAILRKVNPRVVAITGSYGKTSTKGYVKHLADDAFEVVASPASYNNRAGLSRTINDLVKPGVEVLVAEMGTYGPGEIAEMCRFVPPEIAVMTAIGPVHLERFGSLERTLAAKSEITEAARVVVLATDDTLLAAYADRLASETRTVVRCSGTVVLPSGVSVLVVDEPLRMQLHVDGSLVGEAPVGADALPASASNVACAAGAVIALGVPPEALVSRLASLPVPVNRLQIHESARGVRIIDDTYNANPAGARVALDRLASIAPSSGPASASASAAASASSVPAAPGSSTVPPVAPAAGSSSTPGAVPPGTAGRSSSLRVVVTPGMIELGQLQESANEEFGARCAAVATDVVVVGRTNRRALLAGLNGTVVGHRMSVVQVANRDEAVEWVRENLDAGDVVLYENDLPDHFP
jgi:UDP-N-acetylmuramoyl-tripeptide--D-alanyl-D-alanine ligase